LKAVNGVPDPEYPPERLGFVECGRPAPVLLTLAEAVDDGQSTISNFRNNSHPPATDTDWSKICASVSAWANQQENPGSLVAENLSSTVNLENLGLCDLHPWLNRLCLPKGQWPNASSDWMQNSFIRLHP